MTKTLQIKLMYIAALLLLVFAGAYAYANTLETKTRLSTSYESLRHYISLGTIDDSATSSALSIAGAKKVQVYMSYTNPAGTGNGTTTFSVEVSPNGTDWYDYNKLISNVADTNAQSETRVGSVEMSATTSATYALDLEHDTFRDMRCIAAMQGTTTAKVASCEVSVEE